MKKIIALACLSMLPLSYAAAEGYQVNSQSTKQSGMGHVGAAMKLGAESMHFNPAGLAFMDKNIDLSAGVSGVFANAKYTAADGYVAKSDNKASTPMYLYAGFKIYDFLAAGISLNTPYGSAINWGQNWRGAHLVQDISLKSFSIQPTVSWKIMDRLSVGAGLMVMFGDFSMSRAIIPAGSLEGFRPLASLAPPALGVTQFLDKYKDTNAASAALTGDASVRVGYNVGAMFDVNDKITIGLSYRSKVKMQVNEGNAELIYANEAELKGMFDNINKLLNAAGKPEMPFPVPPLDKGTFSAELPLPSNWNVAISYKPIDRLLLSGEVQFVGWGAYKELNVQFTEEVLGGYSIDAVKNYKNTRIYRLGGQFAATDRLDVRLGVYYDESPVKDEYLNPETPSMNKLGLTTGLSFRPITNLSVDFAFSYVTGFGRDGSYTDIDPATKKERTFAGKYDVYAFTPSIGVSYAF